MEIIVRSAHTMFLCFKLKDSFISIRTAATVK